MTDGNILLAKLQARIPRLRDSEQLEVRGGTVGQTQAQHPSGVSNLWPTDCTQLRGGMNGAQHKITDLPLQDMFTVFLCTAIHLVLAKSELYQ